MIKLEQIQEMKNSYVGYGTWSNYKELLDTVEALYKIVAEKDGRLIQAKKQRDALLMELHRWRYAYMDLKKKRTENAVEQVGG